MLFLVGAGELPEAQMRAVTIALSRYWNNEFRKISCEQSPNEEISLLNQKDGLFQLEGDAASANHEGGCWLESLGTWKIPTILMVLSSSDGSVPGIASAYVALCKSLSVPLIGIVQLGRSGIGKEDLWMDFHGVESYLYICQRINFLHLMNLLN